ncbi:MAG: FecR domain-containing protein [Lautropia sp.]
MRSLAAGAAVDSTAEAAFRVLQEAAEWFALLRSPSAGTQDIERWRSWLAADAAHREAWARVEAISGKFERLPTDDKPAARHVLDAAAERQATRRRAIRVLSLLCGTGAGAWAVGRFTPWQSWTAAYRTGTGESREVRLADGASIWLNTDTAIDVDYSATLRRIVLRTGEILVQTEPDTAAPPRPFVVEADQGRLHALGTRFSARRLDDAGLVAVFDGAVEIRPRNPAAGTRVVRAGEQARFTASGVAPVTPAEMTRQSWVKGLLVAENMRLEDFLSELSRYRHGYLGCDPAVADVRIVGTYALADTDRVLAALEATLPVRVRARLPWWTVVEPR